MHNVVNERLKKPAYDCSRILDDYECGCDEPLEGDDEPGAVPPT